MFLLPRNLPSLLSSGTFRMKHCCILQPTSCLIFDGKNMTCRNAILLLSICLQMVSCFPDYYSAFYFAKKCFSNILEGSLLSVMKCVIRIFRVPQSWRNLATGQLSLCAHRHANKELYQGNQGFTAELLMQPLPLSSNFLSDLWQLL